MAQVFLVQEPVLTSPAASRLRDLMIPKSPSGIQSRVCVPRRPRPGLPAASPLCFSAWGAGGWAPQVQIPAPPLLYDLGPPTLTAGTRCPRLSNGNGDGSFR